MSKAPAYQWYTGDWRKDTQVQMSCMTTRGVWREMLDCMWDAPERGKLSGTMAQFQKLLGCREDEWNIFYEEFVTLKIGDVSQNGDGIMTFINRRMFKEEQSKKLHRDRQVRYLQKGGSKINDEKFDAPVTKKCSVASSSSSSSSSLNNKDLKPLSKPKKQASPDVKKFIDFYYEEFKKIFGTPPIIKGGKDGKIVKQLLINIPLDELKSLLVRFFSSDDPFILKSGYTLGVFNSDNVLNKLRIGEIRKLSPEEMWELAKEEQLTREGEYGKKRPATIQIGNE